MVKKDIWSLAELVYFLQKHKDKTGGLNLFKRGVRVEAKVRKRPRKIS